MANPIHPNFSLEIVKHVMCLDGKNFTPYKHNMNMIFRLKNLSGFVEVSYSSLSHVEEIFPTCCILYKPC